MDNSGSSPRWPGCTTNAARQVDIAETLHLSQARVSRLLKRAAELGIVRTVVAVAPGVHTEVEEALEETYGLAEAVVVDVDGTDEEIIAGLGSAGATYLANADGRGTGRDLELEPNPARRCGPDAALPGPWGRECHSANGRHRKLISQTQGNRLLTEFARLVGASASFVPAPALVGNRTMRESLLNDPAMESVAKEWTRLTMAARGHWQPPPSPLLRASEYGDLAEQDRLHAAGAVGDVCQRFFDSAGNLVPSDLDDRVVGVDADTLRKIPRRIGIAGGKSKHALQFMRQSSEDG